MEEGSFSLVVQFTFYESLNAARLQKCVQSNGGGGSAVGKVFLV